MANSVEKCRSATISHFPLSTYKPTAELCQGRSDTAAFTLDTAPLLAMIWGKGKWLCVRSVTSHALHCPFQGRKVKGDLRPFFTGYHQ